MKKISLLLSTMLLLLPSCNKEKKIKETINVKLITSWNEYFDVETYELDPTHKNHIGYSYVDTKRNAKEGESNQGKNMYRGVYSTFIIKVTPKYDINRYHYVKEDSGRYNAITLNYQVTEQFTHYLDYSEGANDDYVVDTYIETKALPILLELEENVERAAVCIGYTKDLTDDEIIEFKHYSLSIFSMKGSILFDVY